MTKRQAAKIRKEREAAAAKAKQVAADGLLDQSMLREMTGETRLYWVTLIQQAIVWHSDKTNDPDHDSCAPLDWIGDLAKAIYETFPEDEVYDGNMRIAACMGLACTLWYSRVQRAKAYDPRRPVEARRAALQRWREFWRDMMDAAIFEGEDPKHFPGQHWDPPWSDHAIDGTFR